MRVYLIGFMGCGKSTIGPQLARRFGVGFVDLDAEIARRAGRPIAAIFEDGGETEFRRCERQALLATGELAAAVVATGGGCPVAPENRTWMRAHGRVLWLNLPWPSLARRLGGGDASRPLWSSVGDAQRLYERRLHAYQDCDHEIAITAEANAEEVAARIFVLLGAMPDPARPRSV